MIKPQYRLRGWKDLPYALQDCERGGVFKISPSLFNILESCDGETELALSLLSEQKLKLLEYCKKIGIIDELSEKMPMKQEQRYLCYPNRAVFSAKWSVTGRCNYSCRHCFLSESTKCVEPTTDECKQIIDQLAQCGIAGIALTGGEPLVRDDLFELISYLHEKSIAISEIYTNGSLLTRELLELLLFCKLRPCFGISFDGLGFHDQMREMPGAEEAAVAAIKLCKELGFPVAVEFCLCRDNMHILRDTLRFLGELGVDSVIVAPVLRMGNWASQPESKDLSLDDILEFYLSYIPEYFEDGMPVSLSLNGIFTAIKKSGKYSVLGDKYPVDTDCNTVCVCEHARHELYLTAEGEVLPCMPLANSPEILSRMLNIKTTKLSDILEDPIQLSYINMTLGEYLEHNPECSSCEYRLACGAGCRADAFFATGNYFGPDKTRCILLKSNAYEKVRLCAEKARKQYVL